MLFALGVLVAIACITPSRVGAAAQDPGMTWLIFVDDLHLDFTNTGHVRELLRSMTSELIRDGDAFVVRSSGPSSISIPFTTNRSLLDGAIRNVAGNALKPSDILRGSPLKRMQDEVRYRASIAGSAAAEMLNADPSPSSRRRAMLYVSDGYYLDPPEERVAEFPSAAQRSNVIVFAIRPRGLPNAALPVKGDAALWASDREAMLNSLRAISEPTGGFAVLDKADFAEALVRIGRWLR